MSSASTKTMVPEIEPASPAADASAKNSMTAQAQKFSLAFGSG
ncbi:MAG: hypothetical protein WAN65_31035 [Candidatus Sulfotelmatobacter sp.]